MFDNAISVTHERGVVVIRIPVEVMSESSRPQHGEINILVRESTVEAQVEFRHTGMTGEIPVVRITIVHIPIAVGIENVTIPKLVFGNRLHSSE